MSLPEACQSNRNAWDCSPSDSRQRRGTISRRKISSLEIDAQLDFSAIDMPLLREVEILQPFGIGNPEPVFMTGGAEVCERKLFSAGIRLRLRQGDRVIGGVMFGAGDDFPGMPGERLDVAYRLSENNWNGVSSVELKILDARRATEV